MDKLNKQKDLENITEELERNSNQLNVIFSNMKHDGPILEIALGSTQREIDFLVTKLRALVDDIDDIK